MKITIIDNGPWVIDQENEYRSKKIHLVCVAVNALTTYGTFVRVVGGMSHEKADELANLVNDKNETGTLYPIQNMTIVPLSVYGSRNDFGNIELIRKHISDCFESNEKYVKCPELIFALERRGDFDIDTFFNELNNLIKTFSFSYTKKIIFYTN
jgi:hypothetical protein